MSDEYDGEDGFDGAEGDEGGPRTNSEFAALRKANQAAKRAERERDDARKEVAFLRAGIDPTDVRLSYFTKGYEGDLKPDAIRQAAIDAGFIQPPPPSPEQVQAQQGQEAVGRVAGYAAGAQATPGLEQQQTLALEEAYRRGGMDGLTAALRSMGIEEVTH